MMILCWLAIGLLCFFVFSIHPLSSCEAYLVMRRSSGRPRLISPSSTTALMASMAMDLSASSRYEARKMILEGMNSFRQGQVKQSIDLFDKAETVYPPIADQLWQRGISYYYDDRFVEASNQFRRDVKLNPNDVEEIVWDIASQLRFVANSNKQFPLKEMMSLPPGTKDPRRIMPFVYKLFRGEGNERDLALAGHSSGR